MKKPWEKNLYSNTEYEDNYTDSTFLKDLRTNINVRYFTYLEAVAGASLLNNQITCITGFLIIFYMLYSLRVQSGNVLTPLIICVVIGYICYRWPCLTFRNIVDDSKTLLAVLVFGYIFAPILHTLTATISTDTIFFLTFFVMFLNVIFHDYGLTVAMVSRKISVNAAIFGSICLASRLPTSYDAFVLLVVAVVFFVLYPMFMKKHWRSILLLPMTTITSLLLLHINHMALSWYMFLTGFINIICPFLFVRYQKYKNNIHGPWDEAIVAENNESTLDDMF